MSDQFGNDIENLRKALNNQVGFQPLYGMGADGKLRRVSWSPLHRWLYKQWNRWLVFWLGIRYGVWIWK